MKRDDESGFDIFHPEKDAEVGWLSILLFKVKFCHCVCVHKCYC